ncbi:MAG TPA: hypothetical protein VK731_04410, partial [Candidatus Cybelea sp.]|nr:hypothetical protein [Candidatus Cybelea sp.]
GAYKLLAKTVLPNFSGTKRPTPPTTSHPEPAKTQPAFFKRLQAKAQRPVAARVVPVPAPAPMPATAPVTAQAPAKDMPTKPALWSRLAAIPTDWARQWIPWRKAQPFQSPTVQTELALDKVRVIRNDLSEDDLEVVMIDKKAGNKTDKPAHSEEVEREKLTANP